jgi:hypothetical protein
MIISIHRKFIFVANLKTASTSIENILRPYGDINILWTDLGKHIYLSAMQERFSWLFREYNINQFFVFGVMRDPVEYMKSLYRSHADKKFEPEVDKFTGNMTFSEFLTSWVPRHKEQAQPQIHRFLRQDGSLGLQSVIPFEELQSGFQEVLDHLKLKIDVLPKLNVSPPIEFEVNREEIDLIRIIFKDDYNFLNNRKSDDFE